MPAGSPAVMATRGLVTRLTTQGSRAQRHGERRYGTGAARSVSAGTAMAARSAGAAAAGPAAGGVVAAAFASAPAVRLPFGVGQFIAQAAFQSAAQARELGRVQAQLL